MCVLYYVLYSQYDVYYIDFVTSKSDLFCSTADQNYFDNHFIVFILFLFYEFLIVYVSSLLYSYFSSEFFFFFFFFISFELVGISFEVEGI